MADSVAVRVAVSVTVCVEVSVAVGVTVAVSVCVEVSVTVGEAVQGDGWCREHPPQVEWFGWMTDPWVEPQDSSFLKEFLSVGERVLGGEPVILGSSGGLHNRFAPYFDTPSFSFGPAGGNHHRIDEYVEIPSLTRVTKTLAVFAAEWCGLTD